MKELSEIDKTTVKKLKVSVNKAISNTGKANHSKSDWRLWKQSEKNTTGGNSVPVIVSYSRFDIKGIIIKFDEISELLKSIFNEREYDEWSEGEINQLTLLGLQEKLKHRLEDLIRNYITLLVSVIPFEEVRETYDWIKEACSDIRYINRDRLPTYGIELVRAKTRIDIWKSEIKKMRKGREYLWLQIKKNILQYVAAFIVGIITSIVASYVYAIIE